MVLYRWTVVGIQIFIFHIVHIEPFSPIAFFCMFQHKPLFLVELINKLWSSDCYFPNGINGLWHINPICRQLAFKWFLFYYRKARHNTAQFHYLSIYLNQQLLPLQNRQAYSAWLNPLRARMNLFSSAHAYIYSFFPRYLFLRMHIFIRLTIVYLPSDYSVSFVWL